MYPVFELGQKIYRSPHGISDRDVLDRSILVCLNKN